MMCKSFNTFSVIHSPVHDLLEIFQIKNSSRRGVLGIRQLLTMANKDD